MHLFPLLDYLTYTNVLDFLGAFFAFVATIYYVRAHPGAWPISLSAIAVNIFLYWRKGLYGDTGLQLVYIAMIFYGWWQWLHGNKKNKKQHAELPITRGSSKTVFSLLLLSLLGVTAGSLMLRFFTDSQVPYWDATTTVLSLLGQWLMCRKIIETWVVWFVVDALFAGLYIYKGIPMHALLQLVYLGMAVAGYLNWARKIRATPAAQTLAEDAS